MRIGDNLDLKTDERIECGIERLSATPGAMPKSRVRLLPCTGGTKIKGSATCLGNASPFGTCRGAM